MRSHRIKICLRISKRFGSMTKNLWENMEHNLDYVIEGIFDQFNEKRELCILGKCQKPKNRAKIVFV